MTETETYQQLTGIMRDLLMQDELVLHPELTPNEVNGWDSLMTVSIIVAVEAHFGIKLHSQQLDSIGKVGDLAGLIQAHTQRSH